MPPGPQPVGAGSELVSLGLGTSGPRHPDPANPLGWVESFTVPGGWGGSDTPALLLQTVSVKQSQPECTRNGAWHIVGAQEGLKCVTAVGHNVIAVVLISVRAGLTWIGLGKHVFVQKVPERGREEESAQPEERMVSRESGLR